MGLGAKQFPTYIHTLGQLGFLMLPLRHPTPPPPVRGSACVGERGGGGGGGQPNYYSQIGNCTPLSRQFRDLAVKYEKQL